jgi:hypothetical protein
MQLPVTRQDQEHNLHDIVKLYKIYQGNTMGSSYSDSIKLDKTF